VDRVDTKIQWQILQDQDIQDYIQGNHITHKHNLYHIRKTARCLCGLPRLASYQVDRWAMIVIGQRTSSGFTNGFFEIARFI